MNVINVIKFRILMDNPNQIHIFRRFFILTLLFLLLSYQIKSQLNNSGGNETMRIFSSAFAEGSMIPKKYTCDGINVSPPIQWSVVPEGTKSLAIICDDPDAPMGTWVHWVIYNLPAGINELPENVPTQPTLPDGSRQGRNDFGKIGYGGPCPPRGVHRYYFKIYALSEELKVEGDLTKSRLLDAMKGHVLAEGQLMGTYKR